MKKRFLIICILIILALSVFMLINILPLDIKESTYVNSRPQGMEVTILGGSNMKDKGDSNSCGYIITTANNKLIIVDGGLNLDRELVLDYINTLGNGKVDYWFITHPHGDHVGALIELLDKDDIVVENLCFSFNSLEWYKENDKFFK